MKKEKIPKSGENQKEKNEKSEKENGQKYKRKMRKA